MNDPIAVIGTNSWGSAAYEKIIRGSVVDNDTLKAAMQAAVKSKLLFVDSARDYGFGKGPKLIGLCCPDEIKISSKYTPFTKFKPGQVRESVEKDLNDFDRTSIDVYWLHMPNDIPQYMEELVELYREGTIKNIGVSNFNLRECKLAKSILDQAGIPLLGVQNHYSLIDREWEKNGLLSWCRENGVQFWAWAVLEEGILTGPKQNGEKFAIMKAIYSRKRRKLSRLFALMKEVGASHNLTIPQVAMSFVANKGIVPICGCRKPYQVEQLGVAANTKLSETEMKQLEAVADELNVKVLGPDLFRFAVRK